jgi:guanylate cyclase
MHMSTIQAAFNDQLVKISRIGTDPTDSHEQSLSKTILVSSSLMITVAGIIWGAIYVLFGEASAALFPFGYSIASLVSVAYFGFSRRYRLFRFIQLLLVLLVPFLLMLALGGFMSGSAVVL